MTAQFTEILVYEGKEVRMCSTPLSTYFHLAKIDDPFKSENSALWRGYVGTWEIINDRLYLIGIYGHLKDGKKATLEYFFPGFPFRVFAHWCNHLLRIPQGNILKYIHMGFSTIYESNLFIKMNNGVVINTYTVKNMVETDG